MSPSSARAGSESPRTLLYIDTRSLPIERNAEIQAAVDAGYHVVLAAPEVAGFASYGLEETIRVDVGNYDVATRTILDRLRERGIRPSGILAWKDREVELASRLCRELGLPGTPLDKVHGVRNKVRTRQLLTGVAGASPAYAEIRTEADLAGAIERIGAPALLKPAGNSGGRGMFRIDSREQALETYRAFVDYNASKTEDMYRYYNEVALLEERLQGTEHSIAGAVTGGEIVLFALTDKRIDPLIPIQYRNTTPSLLPPEGQSQMRDLAIRAVRATQIDACGFHVDMMMTAAGPRVLEIGGRLGGECINSHLVPLTQPWLRPYRELIEVVQGRNPFSRNDYTSTAKRRAGTHIIRPPKTGVVRQIRGLEKVWRHPNTRVFMQVHGVGSEMRMPGDRFKAYEIGYVIAQCSLDEDLHAILDEIDALVQVEVE